MILSIQTVGKSSPFWSIKRLKSGAWMILHFYQPSHVSLLTSPSLPSAEETLVLRGCLPGALPWTLFRSIKGVADKL